MDFYIDENLPKRVAWALHALEQPNKPEYPRIHNIYSVEETIGKETTDLELIPKLAELSGILITHDLKMLQRKNEFTLLKEHGVTVFVIVLPNGANFDTISKLVLNRWWEIKEICIAKKLPLICRMPIRGKLEFL